MAKRAAISRRQGRDRAWRGACGPLGVGGAVPKARPIRGMQGRVPGVGRAHGLLRRDAARVTSERQRGSDAGGPAVIDALPGPIFPVTRA